MTDIIIIAAYSKNRVIGREGRIPWLGKYREDLRRFRRLSLNHPVIMGRKTFESLPKALDKRMNLVLSKSGRLNLKGAFICRTLEDAFATASKLDNEIYVIGGQSVYEQTIGRANRMEITEIDGEYEGDAYFPLFDEKDWSVSKRKEHSGFSFITYKREENE